MRDINKQRRPARPQATPHATRLSAGFKAALGGGTKKPHLVDDERGRDGKTPRNTEKDGAKEKLQRAPKTGPITGPRKGHR